MVYVNIYAIFFMNLIYKMYDLIDDGYFLLHRKGMNRPSFDNKEDINHHDPSSSEITEGSSKEGTMESTDEVCNTGEGGTGRE